MTAAKGTLELSNFFTEEHNVCGIIIRSNKMLYLKVSCVLPKPNCHNCLEFRQKKICSGILYLQPHLESLEQGATGSHMVARVTHGYE